MNNSVLDEEAVGRNIQRTEAERSEHVDQLVDTLEMLCRPPLSLLREAHEGVKTLGARSTVVRRLRVLAELIEAAEASPP